MKIIRISDKTPNGFLAVDLSGILSAVRSRAARSMWRASAVEAEIVGHPVAQREEIWATGEAAAALGELARSGARISFTRLVNIARRAGQIIWGEFKGYDSAAAIEPWIIVIAFDSTWFEVHSSDDEALSQLRASFTNVSDVAQATPASSGHNG